MSCWTRSAPPAKLVSAASDTCRAAGTPNAARDGSGPLGGCGVSRHHPRGTHHPDPGSVLAESLLRSHAADSSTPQRRLPAEDRRQAGTRVLRLHAQRPTCSIWTRPRESGLTFVKKQFLPRTGIQYVDLVELLKTRFINPAYPAGRGPDGAGEHPIQLPIPADPGGHRQHRPESRFAELIEFLNSHAAAGPRTRCPAAPRPLSRACAGALRAEDGLSRLGALLLRANRQADRPRIGRRAAPADRRGASSRSDRRRCWWARSAETGSIVDGKGVRVGHGHHAPRQVLGTDGEAIRYAFRRK